MTDNNEVEALTEGPIEWTTEDQLKYSEKEVERLGTRVADLEDSLFNVLFSNEESGLVAHAKRELELAKMLNAEPDEETDELFNDYNNMMGEAVLELVKVFSRQGHSGFSAGLTLQMFEKVANYETLSPNDHSLNNDVSWCYGPDVTPGTHLQCARDPKFFSDDSGKTWYNVDEKD